MTPDQAKETLEKLEQLNRTLDSLEQEMKHVLTRSKSGIAVHLDQTEAEEKCPELQTIHENLGAEFVRRSFW